MESLYHPSERINSCGAQLPHRGRYDPSHKSRSGNLAAMKPTFKRVE